MNREEVVVAHFFRGWSWGQTVVAPFPLLTRVSERQSPPWQLYIMRPSGGVCLSPAPRLSSSVGSVAVTLAHNGTACVSPIQLLRGAHVRSGETSTGLDGSQTPSCSFYVIYLWFVGVFMVQWSIEPPPLLHHVFMHSFTFLLNGCFKIIIIFFILSVL